MKQKSDRLLSPIEKSVKKRVMQWRANKVTRFIPKKLWKDVAALVPGTTINRISKMLRLNHSDIKRHYQEWKEENTAFVELTAVDGSTNSDAAQKVSDTIIEITLQNGYQVTIRQQSSYENVRDIFKTVWNELQ
jgi:hypothetical protein